MKREQALGFHLVSLEQQVFKVSAKRGLIVCQEELQSFKLHKHLLEPGFGPPLIVSQQLPLTIAIDTQGKNTKCSCVRSRCLKLYCQCFGRDMYCGSDCGCQQCLNTKATESVRQCAREQILSRNPEAFLLKVDTKEQQEQRTRGCHCKKSGCNKKYCQCLKANQRCSESCKCSGCQNREREQIRLKEDEALNFQNVADYFKRSEPVS